MFHNRISHLQTTEAPSPATTPAMGGFSLCPAGPNASQMAVYFVAQEQAYRDALNNAKRDAVREVMRRAGMAAN
jgi:hypothetical protein